MGAWLAGLAPDLSAFALTGRCDRGHSLGHPVASSPRTRAWFTNHRLPFRDRHCGGGAWTDPAGEGVGRQHRGRCTRARTGLRSRGRSGGLAPASDGGALWAPVWGIGTAGRRPVARFVPGGCGTWSLGGGERAPQPFSSSRAGGGGSAFRRSRRQVTSGAAWPGRGPAPGTACSRGSCSRRGAPDGGGDTIVKGRGCVSRDGSASRVRAMCPGRDLGRWRGSAVPAGDGRGIPARGGVPRALDRPGRRGTRGDQRDRPGHACPSRRSGPPLR